MLYFNPVKNNGHKIKTNKAKSNVPNVYTDPFRNQNALSHTSSTSSLANNSLSTQFVNPRPSNFSKLGLLSSNDSSRLSKQGSLSRFE